MVFTVSLVVLIEGKVFVYFLGVKSLDVFLLFWILPLLNWLTRGVVHSSFSSASMILKVVSSLSSNYWLTRYFYPILFLGFLPAVPPLTIVCLGDSMLYSKEALGDLWLVVALLESIVVFSLSGLFVFSLSGLFVFSLFGVVTWENDLKLPVFALMVNFLFFFLIY